MLVWLKKPMLILSAESRFHSETKRHGRRSEWVPYLKTRVFLLLRSILSHRTQVE